MSRQNLRNPAVGPGVSFRIVDGAPAGPPWHAPCSENPAIMKRFLRDEGGQTATEYMLIISVVVIAVVAAAYVFLDPFQQGVEALGTKVMTILDRGCINGCYQG